MAGEWRKTLYGPFAADFAECRLVELCDREAGIQTGPFGSQLHHEDYVEAGTPIITVEHLGENRILHQELPRVSDSDRDRLSRYLLRQGDIVFSRVGSVDRRALVRSDEDGWMFSGRCLRVRPDPAKIDSGYLSYFFGLPSFKEYVRSIAVGATMPSLNTSLFSDLVILYPSSIHEQRAIAHILGTLDDKIELNRRQSATLEAMARALFQAWFVDFEPVRAKCRGDLDGRPRWQRGESLPGLPADLYDLFPARLVDSELGPIPEGWKVKLVQDFAKLKGGKQLPKKHISATGPIPVFGGAGIMGYTTKNNADGFIITVGRVGAYCGRFFRYIGKAWINNNASLVNVFQPVLGEWFYQALLSVNIELIKKGAAQPFVSNSDIERLPVLWPGEHLAREFSVILSKIRILQDHNELISHTLAALRDTLLPKLVSGELRVPDAEAFLQEVDVAPGKKDLLAE